MMSGPSILSLTSAIARHASHQHAAAALNITKVDVPGTHAHRLLSFESHLNSSGAMRSIRSREVAGPINLEEELFQTSKAQGRHDAALSFWKSGLKMLRIAVGAPQS